MEEKILLEKWQRVLNYAEKVEGVTFSAFINVKAVENKEVTAEVKDMEPQPVIEAEIVTPTIDPVNPQP